MDNMTKKQRSHTMSRIRSTETSPERKLRSALHRKGLRFRKNVSDLPGSPDVVLPKYSTIIFVNGCFWHQHPHCPDAVMPKSNTTYWKPKLERNIKQDAEKIRLLDSLGWKVIVVWECEIERNMDWVVSSIMRAIVRQEVV